MKQFNLKLLGRNKRGVFHVKQFNLKLLGRNKKEDVSHETI